MAEETREVKLTDELVGQILLALGTEWETARETWIKADELPRDGDKKPLKLTRVRKALMRMAEEGTWGVESQANPAKRSASDGRDEFVFRKKV